MMGNHVVKGLVSNSAIRPGESTITLEGPIFFNSIDNGTGMAINGSSRIIGEIEASNGIVYVVTNQIIEDIFFMLPFMPRTLGVDVSTMIKALEISGVSNMINHSTKGLFTLFVPSNGAFEALPRGTLESLMSVQSKLKQLVLNHLLPSALFIDENNKVPLTFLKTAGGSFISFRKTSDGKMVIGKNGAAVIFPNRPGNNGVNHIIDKIITIEE